MRSPDSQPRPVLWRWSDPPRRLAEHWERGGVVVIPTESSYGLAANPLDAEGVEAVFRIKSRPEGQALPVVAGRVTDLERLGLAFDEPALAPVVAAWPAPLTAIVPCAAGLPAASGLSSLAVRIPAHRRLRALLAGLGVAVTATSANRSGEPPVTTVDAALELVDSEDAIVIDDGELPGGAPSTIVRVRDGGLAVLRGGRFPGSDLGLSSDGFPQ